MLAENLGMTVAELNTRLTQTEYNKWRAFYAYRNALEQQAAEKAKAEAKVRR